jgi:hypothetical protein
MFAQNAEQWYTAENITTRNMFKISFFTLCIPRNSVLTVSRNMVMLS